MNLVRVTLMAATLALAGCATLETSFIRGGGRGLPEVRMETYNDTVVPPGRGTTALAIRAFVPAADGGWQEVPGTVCKVTGGEYYRITVATPVRLLLPDLGPDAPILVADCRSGALAGRAGVAPGYAWPEEGRPNPLERMIWGQGWWWGYRKTGPMGYGDLAVPLR